MAVPHNLNGTNVMVSRPCRGLLLLRAIAARLYYVWNPSMGQITSLPDGRTAPRRRPGSDYASFGLGYDARTRSHKVVRLLYHDSRPAGCDIYDVGGAVSTGHWRPAASGAVPPERVRMNQMGVFAQGHVHWITMTWNHLKEGDAIVSFSMAREEFGHVTPLPVTVASYHGFKLTELAGCLCLVSARHDCSPLPPTEIFRIDIWLLTNYSAGAWEKHWRIDLPDVMFNNVAPVALVDGGRRILLVSDEYQVAAYCLATGTLEKLAFPGGGSSGGAHDRLVPYEESLVPAGLPFEDVLFSSPAARALSLALRRLPARTLGRLKLVCRSWRAMVESHRFATWHNACARAAAATSPVLPVVFVGFGFGVEAGTTIASVSLESCSGGDPSSPSPPLDPGRVVCRRPCHGLLLLSHETWKHHAVLNPVTRGVRFLDMPGDDEGCAGLGYDPARQEHVLVRLSYTSRCFDTRAYAMTCRVWPVRDPRPRTLASRPPIPAAADMPPVHVGGKMYWPGEPRLSTAADILAFDVCTETFDPVPAPPVPLDDVMNNRVILAELSGKLCAMHLSTRSTDQTTMTVWGKSLEGWTREHVIQQLEQWPEFSPRSAEELPVLVAVDPRDGGRILLDTGKALGYYDTRTRTFETVYSIKPKLLGDHCHADDDDDDDVFFTATLGEDSLFRPCDRVSRLW